MHVLVVDDNVDLAETLAIGLGMYGHSVETARDGAEGLAKARAACPDVVVCDLGMPIVNGFEFARAARQDPGLSQTRLIALSAYHQRREEALAAGFNLFVPKPTDLRELAALLAS
jgi:CheY-like chemotaxis protein